MTTESETCYGSKFERGALAGLLMVPELVPWALRGLRVTDFENPDHREIYAAIEDLHREEIGVDLRTLGERLEQRGSLVRVGGLAYLASLDEHLPEASLAEVYIEIIRSRAAERRLPECGLA